MKPVDIAHMRNKPHFASTVSITEKLGLHHLMGLQCDYSKELVHQFFSSLVMVEDNDRTLKWMTDATPCTSNFYRFATVLGYQFRGAHRHAGHRVFNSNANKDVLLADLYGPRGIVGEVAGLREPYSQLVLLYRDSITPSGGNNDAIRGPLVGLLALSHECATSEDPTADFRVDVMDIIYHEMRDAYVNRRTIPYAPFIMMLIKATMQQDFNFLCTEKHKVKKPYVKKTKTGLSSYSSDSFMGDARAAGAPRVSQSAPSAMAREVKKLSWWQKLVLCTKVDDHKAAYQHYQAHQDLAHSQSVIIHHVSGASGAAPRQSRPIPYSQWCNDSGVDYRELERQLSGAHHASASPPADSPPTPHGQDASDDDDFEDFDGGARDSD